MPNIGSIVRFVVKSKQNHSIIWSKFVLKSFSKHQADMKKQDLERRILCERIVCIAFKNSREKSENWNNVQQDKTRIMMY